jgi:Mor family transcriptional regulator
MQYHNAEKLLPSRLLREVQAYAGGTLLYIPINGGLKNQWGSRSGAKLRYTKRNAEIRSRYKSGETLGKLADVYCLSEDSIRKIVRRRENE